jgi:hypothetical protein
MRTKALLGAAALAAGALTTMAQSNVYSLNVVGYINLTLTEGVNLIANQLDADGYGTNNTVPGVFGSVLPPGSSVYTWNGASYNIQTWNRNKPGTATNWNTPSYSLNPGQGAWVVIPSGTLGTTKSLTVTTVGTVLQGALVNSNLPALGGVSLVSSIVPLAGGLQTALGYNAGVNDTVYAWNGTSYTISTYALNKTKTATNWGPSEPAITVGEGFWLKTSAGAAWSNYFTVN